MALVIAVYFSYVGGRFFHAFLDATSMGTIKYSLGFLKLLEYLFNPYASGGLMFYGSLIGALFGVFLTYPIFKQREVEYLRCFDMFIICFVFSAIFTRMDDLRIGCSFGFPFESSFSLVYPARSAAARQLAQRGIIKAGMPTPPLFPTQVLIVIAKIIIFFTLLLKSFKDKKKVPLNYVALFFLIYGPYRFCIDFLRFDRAEYFLGITVSQWLSLFFFVLSLLYYKFLYKKLEKKYCLKEGTK